LFLSEAHLYARPTKGNCYIATSPIRRRDVYGTSDLAAALILAFTAAVGGALMVISTGYDSGTVIIQGGKAGQFQVGLTLLMVGVAGLAFLAWFYAVNGKDSFFRRRVHQREPASQV